ncbi:hypothetical protein Daus18300_008546 [Diaporthe australafricana]|uniref:Uncharacterized protein n=1 Tax=Diaporthe australafricana TaxID=127596 RepID=A0ABR3WHZ9_9PEZI
MDQLTDDTEAASGQNTQTATGLYLRHYIRRIGTQRHCDHLDTLQPLNAEPNERKIESQEVAVLLKARFVQNPLRGYWEVDKQSSTDYTWTTIACCETFELLVQCPPGKSITLGNLDIMVILESCIEDANGDAFIRKLTSTAKCWPTGHVTFRWLLRGTTAQEGPVVKRPEVQRQKSVKQRLNPFTLLQRDPQLPGAGSTRQDRRATLPAGITASQTAPSQTRRWSSWAQRDQDDQRDDHAVGGIFPRLSNVSTFTFGFTFTCISTWSCAFTFTCTCIFTFTGTCV